MCYYLLDFVVDFDVMHMKEINHQIEKTILVVIDGIDWVVIFVVINLK